MLKIRLKKLGRKNKPFYRIVLMENLSKRDGKSIVELGYYDPISKSLNIDKISLHKYINCGAYPTDTIRHLIYKMIDEMTI
uniref:Ribosomal protein S16 n=1 Tax=Mallomonas splendens TaxID=52552 RepID=A0A3G2QZF5_9STRA|nr:ribosomal protein S16 [Mallomonas splendens]AYO28520.1 ribosomal protein S16 [Mallomonas splendens]